MKLRTQRSIIAAVIAVTTFSFTSSIYAYGQRYKGESRPPRYQPVANYKAELPTEPVYNCCNKKILMDGIYIGLDGSYDSFRIRQTSVLTDAGETVTHNPALSLNGWDGAVFAGYGRYFDWFYMGGEILAKYSGAKNNYTVTFTDPFIASSYNLRLKARQTYGVGLMPGVKVNDSTLVYFRVDYLRSLLDTNETISIPGASFNFSHSTWSNGVDYGVGIETALIGPLSLRAEYTYTSYSNFFSDLGSKFQPSNNQFDLGLIIHFC